MPLYRFASICIVGLTIVASAELRAEPGDIVSGSHQESEMPQKLRGALTAEDQSSRKRSIEITRAIRKELMTRNDLSIQAKNIKIITDDHGNVTLRGSVDSSRERNAIEKIARSLVGVGAVANELELPTRSNFLNGEINDRNS